MSRHIYIVLSVLLVLCACNSGKITPDEGKVASQMAKSPKRGVAFNFSQADDLPLLTGAISWDYNWGNDQNSLAAKWMDDEGVEFCPMCWSNNYSAERIRTYVAAHPSVKYLLAYNEPNLTDQANMTPAQAAARWQEVVALAKELNLKLVSPAMNYGTLSGYGDPIKWLDEFFAQPQVSPDDVDAIAIHCYMASPQAVKDYIAKFEKYGKPIWLTEFCAWEEYAIHSEEDQMKYMCAVLNYLEQDTHVERYAWFIPRAKAGYPYMQLLTSATPYELTPAGQVYCGFSSFDRSVYLRANEPVNASQYIRASDDNTQVRPSTDGDGLMLSTWMAGQTVQYQIYLSQDAKQMQFRYAAISEAEIFIYADDEYVGYYKLTKSGDNMSQWSTITLPAAVKKGTHTLRLEPVSGVMNVYWFKFM